MDVGDMSKYWFDYDDDPSISEVYGRLYTANAATNGVFGDGDDVIQGICPTGWHVAMDMQYFGHQLQWLMGPRNIVCWLH
jgi:uncharacterized protein (TIGR02145 family)